MPRDARGALARFLTLAAIAIALLAGSAAALAGEAIVSSRVWPAQEYTRVTLESARALKHQFLFVNNPERLVVDLEGVDLNDERDWLYAEQLVAAGTASLPSIRQPAIGSQVIHG